MCMLKNGFVKETLRTQISNPFSSCIIFFEFFFLTFHLFAVLLAQKFVSVDQKNEHFGGLLCFPHMPNVSFCADFKDTVFQLF